MSGSEQPPLSPAARAIVDAATVLATQIDEARQMHERDRELLAMARDVVTVLGDRIVSSDGDELCWCYSPKPEDFKHDARCRAAKKLLAARGTEA